jgi:hypothetical protein
MEGFSFSREKLNVLVNVTSRLLHGNLLVNVALINGRIIIQPMNISTVVASVHRRWIGKHTFIQQHKKVIFSNAWLN